MSKGDMALIYDGTRAWTVSPRDSGIEGSEEGVPISEALHRLARSKSSSVILLPPATAVVWVEVEEVTPAILKRAPLPFLAPYVPQEYLERFRPELWTYRPTDRGTWQAAYLLFDKKALKETSEIVVSGILTPWEILSEKYGAGTYKVQKMVYQVEKDDTGILLNTRTLRAEATPSGQGKPVEVGLTELAEAARGLSGRRIGSRVGLVSTARWILAAGMLLMGLALLHTGLIAHATALNSLHGLVQAETDWSLKLTGETAKQGEFVKKVRRAIVMPQKQDDSMTARLSQLDGALKRAGISARPQEISVETNRALVKFMGNISDDDSASLKRAGFNPGPSGAYVFEYAESGK